MDEKVTRAVIRLQKILPIKSRLDSVDSDSAQLYDYILRYFYEQGRAPLMRELELVTKFANKIIVEFAKQDLLTLDALGEVKGCYPFTMEKRIHRIQINGFEVHAMCALDGLAPSAMFGCKSKVRSECALTGEEIYIELDKQKVINVEQAQGIYFGLNWMAASSCGSCSDNLCTEMLFFKDSTEANRWFLQDQDNREVFSLEQAIAFSAKFFVPMMKQN